MQVASLGLVGGGVAAAATDEAPGLEFEPAQDHQNSLRLGSGGFKKWPPQNGQIVRFLGEPLIRQIHTDDAIIDGKWEDKPFPPHMLSDMGARLNMRSDLTKACPAVFRTVGNPDCPRWEQTDKCELCEAGHRSFMRFSVPVIHRETDTIRNFEFPLSTYSILLDWVYEVYSSKEGIGGRIPHLWDSPMPDFLVWSMTKGDHQRVWFAKALRHIASLTPGERRAAEEFMGQPAPDGGDLRPWPLVVNAPELVKKATG